MGNDQYVRFARTDFEKELRKRVQLYFKTNNLDHTGNYKMVTKAIGMVLMYLVPMALFYIFQLPVWLYLLCWVVSGLGMSGIGMGVMHDALHGSYHKNSWVNRFLGASIYMICGNASTWKVQHNVLHHTFTNIDELDEDMDAGGLIRMHHNQPWKKMHKYQHLYFSFVYGLLTLNWLVTKDFKQAVKYRKRNIAPFNGEKQTYEWSKLVIGKILYVAVFLALPIVVAPYAWYWTVLGFVMMHYVSGVVLSFIFQLAHMVEIVEHEEKPEEGKMEVSWMEHQLRTTANFARKNKLISWYVGGLNFQVEHHLFPNICHIHYPAISKIVEETANEFNVMYRQFPTMAQALVSHFKYIHKLSLVRA